jgi:hypothetical protein
MLALLASQESRMIMFRKPLSTAVLPLFLASACSDPTGNDTGNLPACTGTVAITVSAGKTPSFNWTPACSVFFVLVEAAGGTDQWSIITDSTNGIVVVQRKPDSE